jgi:hypothetical protein
MMDEEDLERVLMLKEVEKRLRKVSAFSVFDVNCSENHNYSNVMSSELPPSSTNIMKST